MKNLNVLIVVGLLMLPGLAGPINADPRAEEAICPVCRVHEGESEAETVVARAEHEGHRYGFCSTKCRDTFVAAPDGYLPPVFPRPAPSFGVTDLEGNDFSSETLAGRVVLLDFWATWCPPCVADFPRLSDLHERLEDRGLTVVSVSIDEGKNTAKKVARMVRKRKATHPVYVDAGASSAWSAYRVAVVPTQFLIDTNGQIVAQWSGVVDLDQVETEIIRLLESGL